MVEARDLSEQTLNGVRFNNKQLIITGLVSVVAAVGVMFAINAYLDRENPKNNIENIAIAHQGDAVESGLVLHNPDKSQHPETEKYNNAQINPADYQIAARSSAVERTIEKSKAS